MLSLQLTFHDALFSSEKLDEVVDTLTSPNGGLEIVDRRSFLRSYPKTFIASDLLRWLEKHAGFSREQALFFARLLNTYALFAPAILFVSDRRSDESYWRFQCHEEGPLNFKRVQIWDNDHNPNDLVELLLGKLLRLVKRIVHIKNGSFASTDLEALTTTKEFEQFEVDAADLQRVNLSSLSKDQKTAFWINAYNLLALHAFASETRQRRDPFVTTYFNKRAFFTMQKYLIAGYEYSLDDIEQGVLRATPSYFQNGDPRHSFVIQQADARFIWALNTVTRSSPAPLIIRSSHLDLYLGYACSRHMQSTLRIEEAAIVLPRHCLEVCQPNTTNQVDVILRFISSFLGFLELDWEPRIDLKEFDPDPAAIAAKGM